MYRTKSQKQWQYSCGFFDVTRAQRYLDIIPTQLGTNGLEYKMELIQAVDSFINHPSLIQDNVSIGLIAIY